ncbi:hypothetical protein FisN_1Hh315 [Fistulifera solaris]|uniref:Uncharacterized protein n=1 Tax=Fistulifera solaris TaxID=1519565 RepID=A0A1Z5JF52_FISSO|nr:hypothetical protein FisN_1Hh315 [Fistulifera solaris]|eukprot:GAX12381.1 hypothetical protein FisN_1Hh315 [Fistulifera solaris]
MAACSRSVYPPAVVKAVQRQMKKRQVGPTSIPKSLELKECMEKTNLKDVVLIEVKTEKATKHVDEVDVLRGQEVIKRHTGKNGSFCFVVRRPG